MLYQNTDLLVLSEIMWHGAALSASGFISDWTNIGKDKSKKSVKYIKIAENIKSPYTGKTLISSVVSINC